jgi:hypothetical protein
MTFRLTTELHQDLRDLWQELAPAGISCVLTAQVTRIKS